MPRTWPGRSAWPSSPPRSRPVRRPLPPDRCRSVPGPARLRGRRGQRRHWRRPHPPRRPTTAQRRRPRRDRRRPRTRQARPNSCCSRVRAKSPRSTSSASRATWLRSPSRILRLRRWRRWRRATRCRAPRRPRIRRSPRAGGPPQRHRLARPGAHRARCAPARHDGLVGNVGRPTARASPPSPGLRTPGRRAPSS